LFTLKSNATPPAMPGQGINLDFINKHGVAQRKERGIHAASSIYICENGSLQTGVDSKSSNKRARLVTSPKKLALTTLAGCRDHVDSAAVLVKANLSRG